MSWVAVGVVGGGAAIAAAESDRKNASRALDAQRGQNQLSQQAIEQMAAQARQDAIPLFDAAQQNRDLAGQASLDLFGRSTPEQINQFQTGNVAAQQILGQSLPQVQNALLGRQTDTRFLQNPQKFEVDPTQFQQQLPQFTTPSEALAAGDEKRAADDAVALGEAKANIKTNDDLFRLAATGAIPGISEADQAFWAAHLENQLEVSGDSPTQFVGVPLEDIPDRVRGTTFNKENRAKLDTLLRKFTEL